MTTRIKFKDREMLNTVLIEVSDLDNAMYVSPKGLFIDILCARMTQVIEFLDSRRINTELLEFSVPASRFITD